MLSHKMHLAREPKPLSPAADPWLHEAFLAAQALVESQQRVRVELLRTVVAAGDYRPDPRLVAERILASFCPACA